MSGAAARVLLCLDVHYEEHAATTGCVGFEDWRDARATMELVVRTQSAPEPYEPGEFFRREQPHLVDAIERVRRSACVDVVLVDGHAWLTEGRPGLGARLHEVLGGSIAVVGIAKNEFAGGIALPVLRGESLRPLFVSAAGMDHARAAALVQGMHGAYRVPTLLKRADQLARGRSSPSQLPEPSKGGAP